MGRDSLCSLNTAFAPSPIPSLSLLHFLAFSIPGPLGKSSDVSEESCTVSVAIPSSAQVAFLMQGQGYPNWRTRLFFKMENIIRLGAQGGEKARVAMAVNRLRNLTISIENEISSVCSKMRCS